MERVDEGWAEGIGVADGRLLRQLEVSRRGSRQQIIADYGRRRVGPMIPEISPVNGLLGADNPIRTLDKLLFISGLRNSISNRAALIGGRHRRVLCRQFHSRGVQLRHGNLVAREVPAKRV